MIVWLNGPFGVGKTTLAAELRDRWVTSTVCDPELFGPLVQKFTSGRYEEYHDAPIWRRLVIESVLTLQDEFEHVIVPMTLNAPHSVYEIFGALRAAGAPYVHVFLDSDVEELRRRITEPSESEHGALPPAAVELHMQHIEECLAARDSLPQGTLRLRADKLRVVELADQVIATMTEQQVGGPLRETFEPLANFEPQPTHPRTTDEVIDLQDGPSDDTSGGFDDPVNEMGDS